MKKITFKQIRKLAKKYEQEANYCLVNKRIRPKGHFDKWLKDLKDKLSGHQEYLQNKTKECQKNNSFGPRFNDMYDQEYELGLLIDEVEYDMRCRNWTGQDYRLNALVCANID